MSSRIFQAGSDAAINEVQPIVWRTAGGPAARNGPSPSSGPSGIHRDALDPTVEARVQAAYNRGVTEGEATAQQRAGALAAPVLSSFGSIVRELSAARNNARKDAEESMVKLALAIARRVLHREMSTDPEAILGLVRSGFDRVNAREIHKLRLSPVDAQIVIDNRADLAIPPSVEVQPDRTLSAGSAIFETTRGELDLSVQTQLEEIDRGFADLVARRRA